ncbi:pectate lyase [Actinoplanes lutulentus]|uniref:Pectinesterase n=1 Tax=Actinoplanes lutulentus TaxID=1287878 RepID=A0A327ZB78_9ACTN|nr:pectinesterase family protein [Actinoplanes lutulentus]MBB2947286.1 pectate lyase [Actinoplanes lutulentus]RAK36561.1 pectinesterase [Actinoplanes lutulentus]
MKRPLATLVLVAAMVTAPAASAAPPAAVPDPSWTDQPTGFAAGTTGGAAGRTVRAGTLAELRAYASAPEPLIVQVTGSIRVDPFGDMIRVGPDKSIIGAGPGAELVGGGLFLDRSRNVIIRNLTIRDSYIPGDFDGKSADNDNDGIRLDTADHVWIDHVKIERVGDGGIDVRKDSDHVTLSWNVISDINKALGVGWTSNTVTKLTAHHNWVRNTVQRNWSLDNTEAAHLYNNYLTEVTQYGTMSRNNAKVVVEDSVFDQVNDPLVVHGPAAQLVQRRNLFTGTAGRTDSAGTAFDPAAFYAYVPDPASRVKDLVRRYAGPRTPANRTPRTVTVALDGTGDYGSLLAALGATRDARGRVEIVMKAGHYREQVRIWPHQSGVTVRGDGEVVISYDIAASATKFYGGVQGNAGAATLALLGAGTVLQDLTVQASSAPAVRVAGDRALLIRVRLIGGYDAAAGRGHLRDSAVQGTIDGPGTTVVEATAVTPAAA